MEAPPAPRNPPRRGRTTNAPGRICNALRRAPAARGCAGRPGARPEGVCGRSGCVAAAMRRPGQEGRSNPTGKRPGKNPDKVLECTGRRVMLWMRPGAKVSACCSIYTRFCAMRTDSDSRSAFYRWFHYWVLSFPLGVPVWKLTKKDFRFKLWGTPNPECVADTTPRGILRTIFHLIISIILMILLVNTANAQEIQQRSLLNFSPSVSAGYAMFASGSHDLPSISTAFWEGAYIRYAFEYGKKLSPFMFVSYNRNQDGEMGEVLTSHLWNIVAGTTIRERKGWPFYSAVYAGVENATLDYSYQTTSFTESNKSAVVGGELGLKYPKDSFMHVDIALGFRWPFNDTGLATGWRLGVMFDFSKR